MNKIVHDRPCPISGTTSYREKLFLRDSFYSQEVFPLLENCASGLLITGRAPRGEALTTYYNSKDYISHSNNRHTLQDKLYQIARSFTLRWKRGVVLHSLSLPADELSVLDIGAGTGHFAHTMLQAGSTVVAIEQSESARTVAHDQFGLAPLSTLRSNSFPDASFQAITLWHVLEHIEDLEYHFCEFRRLLAPAGKLFFALPNAESYDARYYGCDWAAYDVPRHLWHFTPRSLELLCRKEGFRISKIIPMKLDAFYIALLSEKYRRRKALPAMARALFLGLKALFRTWQKPTEASSLLYVVEKE